MSRQSRTTRVLVTGATGFLGRNILAALAARQDVTPIAACRTPDRLPSAFAGETRVGDLRDPEYRRTVVDAVDVVCHAGTWGAFWGHAELERRQFFEPNRDLIDQAIDRGVRRFVQTSTIAIAARPPARPDRRLRPDPPHRLLAPPRPTHRHRRPHAPSQRSRHPDGHHAPRALRRCRQRPRDGAALVPRLRTRLVPWLASGRARLALVGGRDLGEAFALAATAERLDDYESFNICGPTSPSAREVIEFIADETGSPRPWFSVPYSAGYAFAWLMEKLHPVLPGAEPFLTRSLVHVSEDWDCPSDHAARTLGYTPREDWRDAVRASLTEAGRRLPLAPPSPTRVSDEGDDTVVMAKLHNGQVLARFDLSTITGQPVQIPDPDRLVHLQFRRFAGCPICNLHLRSITRRHDEIVAAASARSPSSTPPPPPCSRTRATSRSPPSPIRTVASTSASASTPLPGPCCTHGPGSQPCAG